MLRPAASVAIARIRSTVAKMAILIHLRASSGTQGPASFAVLPQGDRWARQGTVGDLLICIERGIEDMDPAEIAWVAPNQQPVVRSGASKQPQRRAVVGDRIDNHALAPQPAPDHWQKVDQKPLGRRSASCQPACSTAARSGIRVRLLKPTRVIVGC